MNAPIIKGEIIDLQNLITYVSHSIVSEVIYRKPTGSLTVVAVDAGETFNRGVSPFDNFIEIIDGAADIDIDNNTKHLEKGQYIIIPAHSINSIMSKKPFKMLLTIIKSGYE